MSKSGQIKQIKEILKKTVKSITNSKLSITEGLSADEALPIIQWRRRRILISRRRDVPVRNICIMILVIMMLNNYELSTIQTKWRTQHF